MNDKTWLQDFVELLGFILTVFLGSAAIAFVSWWIGKGVEFLTGSTPAGCVTFGVTTLLLMVAAGVTLGRRMW